MKKYVTVGIVIIFILLGAFYSIMKNQGQLQYEKITETVLILNNEEVKDIDSIVIENNNIYLPLEFIKKYFDNSIYLSEDGKRAYISLANKAFEMEEASITTFVKESNTSINIPLEIKNDTKYIPINHLEKIFSIEVNYNSNLNTVIIDRFTNEAKFSEMQADNVSVYSKKSVDSEVVDRVNQGNTIRILSQDEDWYKVRTEKGYFGYIEKKYVNATLQNIVYDNKLNEVRKKELNKGSLNITWEYVYEKTPDISDEEKIQGLDVISPTWFSLSEGGVIINKADFNYVKEAHERDYKVWGLVDNGFNPDITSEVINNEELKNRVIAQIAFYGSLYNLDGINIDFENIYYEDKDAFTKFVKDLVYTLKKQNLTVSIDVTVPSGSERWSKVYDRERLAKIVDYVALMAYDEHWATSPVSGSVASIGWVERGIEKSLESIPKEKLLLGIPFYTRVWKETEDENGNIEVSSKAIPIKNVEEILDKHDAKVIWNEDIGQYFATYEDENAVYKIWIEDIKSIKLKIELAQAYGLKGIASWRKGYEYNEVWEVINTVVEDKDLL